MDMGRTPAVFVSSTCYDLSQVRSDLKDFIENHLGFDAVLSEYDSFPLDPNISAIENCVRAVKERADIFVLVVGGKYGHITDSGKSVTNLEYINAKAKGIPIYTFVEKRILNILPTWRTNPNADFTATVDSVKLFKFVDELRGKENIWVYGFEKTQDIVSILKMQIGYLLYDSLAIRKQVCMQKLSPKIMQLEGESLRIILEKPDGWEYILLGQVIKDQIYRSSDLRRDLLYGISFGHIRNLSSPSEIFDYLSKKLDEMLLITNGLSSLYNQAIPVAIGAPGEPGDVEHIVYVGERIGTVYKEFINWGLDFKTISVEEEWQGVVDSLFILWESPLRNLDDYSIKYSQEMLMLKTMTEEERESHIFDLTLTLTPPDLTQYNIETKKIRKKYGLDG